MGDTQDSEAISAYLTDLQDQVRAPSPPLAAAVRVLAEPLSFLGLLPSRADTNGTTRESFPHWAGPVQQTASKQLYFIQHLLPNHLDFILDNITLDWLSALPSAQQTALFDTYFIPALSRQQNAWNALVAVMSLQTLVNRINSRFSENHSFFNKTVLRLLRRLVETYSLADFCQGCSAFGQMDYSSGGTGGPTLDITAWDTFLSKLFSVPTRIANAFGVSLKNEIEECFQEVVFIQRQTAQLQRCLESIGDMEQGLQNQYARALAIVVAKLLRLGYGRILVELVVSVLWGSSVSTVASGWKLVLSHTSSPGTTQLFLTALMDYLDKNQLDFNSGDNLLRQHRPQDTISEDQKLEAVQRGANLLISIGFGAEEKNNGMVGEVLLQGRVFGLGALRMLICIQSGWPTGVRSNKDISYQVLLMLGYLDHKVIFEMDLIPMFGAGMTGWLEIEDFKKKQIALASLHVVAEEFSRIVDTIGSPADFDLNNEDKDVRLGRSLVRLKDGAKPYNPTTLPSFNTIGGPGTEKDVAEGTSTTPTVTQGFLLQEDSDDEEDPDAIEGPYSKAARARKDSSDESSDEEDDLKPYEMEYESDPDEDAGSVKKAKVAVPVYLRDLVSYIRASEDRDKTEIGLKNAAELIRRKVGSLELEEYAEELARSLVLLQDNFDLPGFYRSRENSLIALIVTSPVLVAGVLTQEFYARKNSMGQRLNILTALALGAQELSGSDRPPAVSSSTSAKNVSRSLPKKSEIPTAVAVQKPSFDSITSSISMERTRRFSQKSHIEASRPAPKANAFSNVAPIFLGGLLGRWGGNRGAGMERGYDALKKAPVIVLKKFVITLGVLVHYAGTSPHLIPITRELFQFLLALRYHNPPAQATPGPIPGAAATTASLTGSVFSTPSLTSLRLPGDVGVATRLSSTGAGGSLSALSSGSLPYNPDLVESILFDLLILLTPSTQTLSDQLLMHEFYAEIMECQQWAMELWEVYKLEQGSGEKARMYCAALLQRSFELLEVHM
ncbi:telomere binding protein [Gamsiella multidivaricata]|nr:telomere binding protein [Gamsiella multidivaricata]